MTTYRYVGSNDLTVIVGGVSTVICSGDIVKDYFVPYLKRRYSDFLEEVITDDSSNEAPASNEESDPNVVIVVEEAPNSQDSSQESQLSESSQSSTAEAKYPYLFKDDMIINNAEDLKRLYKEELKTLAVSLGLSSEGTKAELRDRINEYFLSH